MYLPNRAILMTTRAARYSSICLSILLCQSSWASVSSWKCVFKDSAGQPFNVTLSRASDTSMEWSAISEQYEPMLYRTLRESETELVLVAEALEANGITNISKTQQRHASVILIPQHENGDESPWVFRRPFGLSQAAIPDSLSCS